MSSPDQQPSHTSGFYTPVGTRRRFFQWVTRAAAGFIGLSLTVPIIGYVISPALKRRVQSWVDVAAVKESRISEPKQREYVATVKDGYLRTKSKKAVLAIKQADGKI